MDDEANLKRHARRRLIGAVALVTAVVVILPMVLDSTPKVDGQNVDLRIPDPDKVGEFKSKIVLPEEAAQTIASEPAAASAEVASAAVAAPAEVPAAVAQAAAASAPQPAAEKPAKAPEVKPLPKTESKPAEPAHAVPKAGFAVQVGAFSNMTTVKRWQENLRKQGFHVYTEKVGNNVRVRIGPYPSRAAAEQVLHKLEKQGMHPVMVNLN